MHRSRIIAALAGLSIVGCGPTTTQDAGPIGAEAAGPSPELDAAERFLPVPIYSVFDDDSGYELAARYTGSIADRGDLDQLREAIRHRNRRGIADLEATLRRVAPGDPDGPHLRAKLNASIAMLHGYEGDFDAASRRLARAAEEAEDPLVPLDLRANIQAMRGVVALRRGEVANCVGCIGPSSCLFPIGPSAVHQFPEGAAEAVDRLSDYVRRRPEDLGVRWLLQIAHQALGTPGDRIPRDVRMPTDRPGGGPATDLGRFENVAVAAGLTARPPDMAGGSVFDDFNGDGLPDLLWTSFDVDLGAALFVNRGDGTFDDRSEAAGLADQPLAINCVQGDYDNDGYLDVLLLRGGWETPMPLSLLRNRGDGTFEDVTRTVGLGEPIASQSADWADYDLDGDLDLFVCGESTGGGVSSGALFVDADALTIDDPTRNLCRLYRNDDGRFVDRAAEAGVANGRYAKGCAWGDFDDDGWPDLYVSNMGGANRLYRNLGDGTFEDAAPTLGLTAPWHSFPCWWWDFDNDGRLDLFVAEYSASLDAYAADRVGASEAPPDARHRLYRNLGPDGFADVGSSVNLDRVSMPMGANFGDVDNDGFPDAYLATGRPPFSCVLPNELWRNVGGRRFEDVAESTGTGHLQKGHGVSFADLEGDGDLDLFVQLGGAVPGDRSYNALFRNPGHGRHWLTIRPVGTRSNRSAIGARIAVEVVGPDGSPRTVHRLVSSGSSFGGNSLTQTIGLGDASQVASVTIRWPSASGEAQILRDVPLDSSIEVIEGAAGFQPFGSGIVALTEDGTTATDTGDPSVEGDPAGTTPRRIEDREDDVLEGIVPRSTLPQLLDE